MRGLPCVGYAGLLCNVPACVLPSTRRESKGLTPAAIPTTVRNCAFVSEIEQRPTSRSGAFHSHRNSGGRDRAPAKRTVRNRTVIPRNRSILPSRRSVRLHISTVFSICLPWLRFGELLATSLGNGYRSARSEAKETASDAPLVWRRSGSRCGNRRDGHAPQACCARGRSLDHLDRHREARPACTPGAVFHRRSRPARGLDRTDPGADRCNRGPHSHPARSTGHARDHHYGSRRSAARAGTAQRAPRAQGRPSRLQKPRGAA